MPRGKQLRSMKNWRGCFFCRIHSLSSPCFKFLHLNKCHGVKPLDSAVSIHLRWLCPCGVEDYFPPQNLNKWGTLSLISLESHRTKFSTNLGSADSPSDYIKSGKILRLDTWQYLFLFFSWHTRRFPICFCFGKIECITPTDFDTAHLIAYNLLQRCGARPEPVATPCRNSVGEKPRFCPKMPP